jgi:DNA-binding transcriptional ArsR family regulator
MSESNQNTENDQSKAVQLELEKTFYLKMKLLQDPITFKIFLLLLTYNELSLVELTQKVGKSKPTVFRHLQKLIEANYVIESREEKVRGSILAKYYRPKLDNFSPSHAMAPDQLQLLPTSEKIRFYREICQATNVTINFIKSALDELQLYLENKPAEEIPNFVLAPDISLSLNVLSEKAYQKWLEIYQKAMMEFYQTMQPELMNPDTEKPYALMLGILPMKNIYNQSNDAPPENEKE